ncbi:MAG TPA: serine/threonine-protein kinase [Candidatus Obscuribacterales bacterium]
METPGQTTDSIDGSDFEDWVELTELALPSAELLAQAHQPVPGGSFERYRHLRELGQGAMGTVALMQDVLLRRQVAYKQIKAEALVNQDVLRQFLGEAQITAQLEHPGIVPVYSLEVQTDGQIAYAMKVVEGQTLKARLQELREQLQANPDVRRWEQELRALLEDFLKVCEAMAYSHDKGVIHRDLKPSNIMFGKFHEVYLLDWGIAKVVDPAAGVTAEAVDEGPDGARPMTGTPRYMSPEQIKGKGLGPASDLFTLGLILQEVVTLQQAVQAKTLPDVLRKILKPENRPIVHALPELKVPAALKAIVAKATVIKAAERYSGVTALIDDLRRYLQDQATSVLPDTLAGRLLRWIRHHSAQAMALATGLLLLCALGIGASLWAWQQSLEQTRRHRQALEQALKQALMASQRLDSQFGRFEALSEHLAAAGAEAWQRGLSDGPPPLLPASLTSSPDFSAPLWIGPAADARRFTSLGHAMAGLLARAADPAAVPSAWRRQARPQSPIQWALLEFPGERRLLYPATGTQILPALLAGLGQQATALPAWGLPVLDGKLLPVSMQLSTTSRQPLGRAALFVSSSAIEAALNAASIPALTDFWLTDPALHAIAGKAPESLPDPVKAALTAHKSGFFESGQALYLYQPLATGDWYLVLRFDMPRLLN